MGRGIQRLTPKFVERIWGSTHLAPLFPDPDKRIGEVWLEADEPLPLLVKFIFTTDKLSVQVHPGNEYAALHHQSQGKTEMWHVISAEPGAQVAAGFLKPVSREQLREAALSGTVEQLLRWHDAKPGDTFFLPAGTVHAIGAGLVMCEIQQQSDVTYRLYDYGRGRELHLDHSLAVSNLGPHQPRATAREGVLVSCEYFTTSLVKVRGKLELPAHPGQFAIVIRGEGSIAGEATKPGDAWFADSIPITANGSMDLIVTR